VRLFAVSAVATLVVAGTLIALSGGHTSVTQAQQAAKDAGTTRSSALVRLNSLSGLGDGQAAIAQATTASAQVLGKANQPLASALGGVGVQLNDVLNTPVSLPDVPAEYLPGMDLSSYVETPKVAAFPLPAFSGILQVGSFKAEVVHDDPSMVAPRSSLHLPTTGVGSVDALGSQLVDAYGALQQALDDLNVSSLTGQVPTGTLPTDGVPLLGGLSTGMLPGIGLYPSQAQDANDAVDPDERGAHLASDHVGALLGSTEKAFAVSKPSLANLLAGYRGLATQVQDLVDDAHKATQQAGTDIQSELESRLADIKKQADSTQKEAVQTVLAYRRAVEDAAQKAQSSLQDALTSRVGSIQDALASDLPSLNGLASQVQGLAESRKAEIQGVVDSAVANLTRIQASTGVDTTASILAVQSAGAMAMQKVDADALAQAQAFKAAAADLQKRAQAALRQATQAADAAAATLNDTATQAIQQSKDAQAYLVDLARAQAAAAAGAQQKAADAALAQLPTLEQARVAKLVQAGLALTGATDGVLAAVDGLAAQVTEQTGTQAQKDIGYIAKVSHDYGRVPTSERMQRADFWSGIAGTSTDRLAKILSTTQDLQDLASQVTEAAQQAAAQIEGMADGA
jgi:hypothetical protein